MADSSTNSEIAIIGSGFSGLCLAIHLKKAGLSDFVIHEKSDRIGGTWRDNIYPGAACDSPSFAYCFSFEQKTDWSRKWSPQPEILQYIEHCAEKYDLLPHIRLNSEVESARFDAESGRWRLRLQSGEESHPKILVSGVGQLNRPLMPKIAGLERFQGDAFHSAQWKRDCDLRGKRVAVVGNAASAIQFVPEIAKQVEHLTIFQRSANWMLPKFDRTYGEREKRLYRRFPLIAKVYRWWLWLNFEARFPLFLRNAFAAKRAQRVCDEAMRGAISDPALRKTLTPSYPIGGKRILISDDYYPALTRENVDLVTEAIDHVSEDAVVTQDGEHHRADTLILATGFDSTSFLVPMTIEGVDGRSLQDDWKEGAKAYYGISCAGFPNFFMMYGPNTNLGHNSIIFMIECQTTYIMDCIRAIRERGLEYIDLRREVMDAYNEMLDAELEKTVWAQTGKTWYKNEAGKITNNWSGSTARYWWHTRKADLSDYRIVG